MGTTVYGQMSVVANSAGRQTPAVSFAIKMSPATLQFTASFSPINGRYSFLANARTPQGIHKAVSQTQAYQTTLIIIAFLSKNVSCMPAGSKQHTYFRYDSQAQLKRDAAPSLKHTRSAMRAVKCKVVAALN
jgi:hypothetical protein